MYRLTLSFLLLFTTLSSHEVVVSYFDKGKYQENNIDLEVLPTKLEKKELDSALYLALSYPLNPQNSFLTLHAASSIARLDTTNDEMYAYSTYLSARLSPLSFFFVSPFIEVSLAGPTYLSKETLGDIEFGSKVVYQNYISAGIKFTAFIADIRIFNYSESLPTAFTQESTTLPVILSIGCTY